MPENCHARFPACGRNRSIPPPQAVEKKLCITVVRLEQPLKKICVLAKKSPFRLICRILLHKLSKMNYNLFFSYLGRLPCIFAKIREARNPKIFRVPSRTGSGISDFYEYNLSKLIRSPILVLPRNNRTSRGARNVCCFLELPTKKISDGNVCAIYCPVKHISLAQEPITVYFRIQVKIAWNVCDEWEPGWELFSVAFVMV